MVDEHLDISTRHESTMYDLIDVYIADVSDSPPQDAKTQARPYEFEGEQPTKFSSVCPLCGQGIFFTIPDIICRFGYSFVACPECGAGQTPQEIPAFEDPFVNPIKSGKIDDQQLDPDLISTLASLEDDGKTVADRLSEQ